MEPIISPWAFYFMEVADSLAAIFAVIGIVGAIALIVSFIIQRSETDWEWEVVEERVFIKRYIKAIIGCLMLAFLAIFIPSEKTITKMIIDKNVTKDNIVNVLDVSNDIKNELKKDIFEMIQQIKSGDIEKKTKKDD